MPLPALAIPAIPTAVKWGGVGLAALLAPTLIEKAGRSGKLEKETKKYLKEHALSSDIADLLEGQSAEMQSMTESQIGREMGGLDDPSAVNLLLTMLGSSGVGGDFATTNPRDSVVASLEGKEPGLSRRVAQGSRVPSSALDVLLGAPTRLSIT